MQDKAGRPLSPESAGKPPIWQAAWVQLLGRFLALLAVFILFSVLVGEGRFYTLRNLENILRQSAVYATAALGMTMVIIAAGIDLSIGSIIALTSVTLAWVLQIHWEAVAPDGGKPTVVFLYDQWPVLLPILAALAAVGIATLAGFLNGATIVVLRLVPFIVTLGTMMIFRGVAKGIAAEKPVYAPTEARDTWTAELLDPTVVPWINWLTGESEKAPEGIGWLVLPLGVWIFIVGAVAAGLLLRYTRFGRHVFAIGSNQETARLCGVPVGRTRILVFTLAGFFAGLAGLMQFSFEGATGQPTTAVAYELYVIAAVVIGGGSLMGGEGSILGSVIGALIITILYMGGEQANWPKWVQEIAIGAIIVGAVYLDRLRHHRA
jgi:ribose transport system permease protein/erythritol transport system permease protein